MYKPFFALIAIAFFFLSCKDNNKKYKEQSPIEKAEASHPGQKLMQNYCYVCHAPQGSGQANRIAPPVVQIQNYYIGENTSFEDFKEEFISFLNNPTVEKAKMKGAVKKYGLMPYQRYPEEVLIQIAEYLYQNNPLDETKPKQRRQRDRASQEFSIEEKTALGMEYANTTRQLLGQNLMGAIQQEGVMHALEFCNIEAMPLTAKMEKEHHAQIKRVSDRPRNPNNSANEEETTYIAHFQKQLDAGQEPTPIVLPEGNKTRFYFPITTNSMCLQCHGSPERIAPEVLERIDWLYPEDKATGYNENEVRGIFSILF